VSVLTTAILLAGALAVHSPAVAFDDDNPYGVNAHQAADEALDLVEQAGIGWVRFDMNWFQMEPAQGQYDWTIPDRFMAKAESLGLGVFVTVAYSPQWAVAGPCDDGSEESEERCMNRLPTDQAYWTDFVTACVQRYGDTVRHWGMWNEPNLDHFFIGTRDEYVEQILIPGSAAVHAACPGCYVLGPELANLREVHWDAEEGEDYGGLGYAFNGWNHSLSRILEDAGDHIDIVTHHKYTDPADLWWYELLDGEWIIMQIMWGAKEITDLYCPGKEVWITEFGWESEPWGSYTDEYAAEQLTDLYDGMCEVSAGTFTTEWDGPVNQPWPEMRRLFWYDLNEDPTGYSWGLLTWDLIPKDPYYAYADVIAANGNCLQDAPPGDDDDDTGDDDTGDDDSAVADDDSSETVDPVDDGCGCRQAATGHGAPLLGALALAWLATRRRSHP